MSLSLKTFVLGASLAVFSGGALALEKLDVEKSIAAAKAAQKQAFSVDGEWRDTRKMIKKAEKLLSEGKLEEAVAMAREAEAQGMLGYMQATGEANKEL